MLHDSLLTYPDYDEALKINTNDRKFKLWGVISQIGKPINF